MENGSLRKPDCLMRPIDCQSVRKVLAEDLRKLPDCKLVRKKNENFNGYQIRLAM